MGKGQDKGTYILVIELAKNQIIKPGKLKETEYKKGVYLYVGRARKGLRARIGRHLKCQKKIFWHIDYLLQKAKIKGIWIRENYFSECLTASKIRALQPAEATGLKGFGSSDCTCLSHLFYFPSNTSELRSLLHSLGFEKVGMIESMSIPGNKP